MKREGTFDRESSCNFDIAMPMFPMLSKLLENDAHKKVVLLFDFLLQRERSGGE